MSGSALRHSEMSYRTAIDRQPFYGLVVGIVENVIDDLKLGRVEISLPWYPKGYRRWARVAQLYAGNGFGSTWIPERKGEVLVAFDHGDLRSPYVIGCLHGKVDRPPHSRSDSSDIRTLRTPAGSELSFDEQNGIVTLKTPAGATVKLAEKSGEITLTAKSKISLEAPEISINGSSSVAIKGNKIDLN
jgi:uncharacterized protein involved in type VI secretion and phage assembly